VRLAALNLEEDSVVDLEGSGLDPGILGFCVSPKFTCSHFLLMSPYLCNSVELMSMP